MEVQDPRMPPRRWVVTGASRGIGRSIAERAIASGDRVCLVARNPDITEVARELGDRAMGIAADVTDPDQVSRCCEAVAGAWGGVDVLVNNAGLHRGGLVDRIALDDFEAVLDTNVGGPLNTIRSCLPHFPETGGAIVNIGAVVGMRGFAGDVAYGSSKAALSGMTQVLAVELARRGIRVNLVIPGFVSTEMTAEIPEKARARIIEDIPLRREGSAEEIADVVFWVAGSSYMTGSIVATDGGLMCKL
ncbi:SDR family NAD(P)-dependent oxidoreductase [Altererythrobacter sp. GH1-8]|uniref:SDR family NAD(P)-dependent oxidoreductase n=1 Tax=Altererythrobacter sp. GH1-8 TaxID=3349333 RepID=UPI00374D7041